MEMQIVHRRGDDHLTAMALRGHATADVNPLHHLAAKRRIERVGIRRKDHLSHDDFRVFGRFRFERSHHAARKEDTVSRNSSRPRPARMSMLVTSKVKHGTPYLP